LCVVNLTLLTNRWQCFIEQRPEVNYVKRDSQAQFFGSCTGTKSVVEPSYNGEGNTDASTDFERLVELHYGALYRFALSLSHTELDASDLVQETFFTWAAKGHQLLDRSKAKTWLFTTLHRHFLASQRHKNRFPQVDLAELDSDLLRVDPEWLDQLDGQSVIGLLARVDSQFQSPIALYYLEDYSYPEIAAILDVPLGTVKSRISRGLLQLKALVHRTSLRGAPEEKP
jgi:RNA polymerase sigma factor (sigma-70 family)